MEIGTSITNQILPGRFFSHLVGEGQWSYSFSIGIETYQRHCFLEVVPDTMTNSVSEMNKQN